MTELKPSMHRLPFDDVSKGEGGPLAQPPSHDCPLCGRNAALLEERGARIRLAADQECQRLRDGWRESVEEGVARERQLQSELRDSHRQLHCMKQTRSWRWTSILRKCGALFGRP